MRLRVATLTLPDHCEETLGAVVATWRRRVPGRRTAGRYLARDGTAVIALEAYTGTEPAPAPWLDTFRALGEVALADHEVLLSTGRGWSGPAPEGPRLVAMRRFSVPDARAEELAQASELLRRPYSEFDGLIGVLVARADRRQCIGVSVWSDAGAFARAEARRDTVRRLLGILTDADFADLETFAVVDHGV